MHRGVVWYQVPVSAFRRIQYRQDLHRFTKRYRPTAVNVHAASAREDLSVSVSICRKEIIELKSAAMWSITNPQERLDEFAGDDP